MNLRDPPAVTAQSLVTAYFVANILRDIHPLTRFKIDSSGCHHAMNVNMHEHPLPPGVQGNENAWFAAELLLTHFHEDF